MTKTLTEQQIRKIIENVTGKAAKVCEQKFYEKPKSLTEQWYEGTLESGVYYWKLPNNETFMATLYKMDEYKQTKDASQIVCLAPVPSYDEYRELLDLNVYEKDRKKVMRLENKIKRLQEQLKEANEVIKKYAEFNNWEGDDKDQHDMTHFVGEDIGCGWSLATDYLEKWGVK